MSQVNESTPAPFEALEKSASMTITIPPQLATVLRIEAEMTGGTTAEKLAIQHLAGEPWRQKPIRIHLSENPQIPDQKFK